MRAAVFLVWALAAIALVWPRLRARLPSSPDLPAAARDELVKDPVCQTYVVRSRAIARPGPEGPRYFCSDVCARRDA